MSVSMYYQRETEEAKKSYQIVLLPHHLDELLEIQAMTGLRISKVIQFCFEIEKKLSD
ncbi:hypothetical protein ACQCVE_08405 [Metabacillus sp. 113a]